VQLKLVKSITFYNSNDTKKPAASDLSASPCSAELAAVKVGFLVRDENLDIDDFGDALMADVKGDKYEANEWGYQVNGVYCVVEFENVPSPELVETVRQEIYALLSQNIEGSDE